jgi:hypothetical protein
MSTAITKSLVRLSELPTTPLEWLWPGRLPLGKLVLLDGDPERGKSLLALDWAARLTTGRSWPDGTPIARPESVVVLSAEDDPSDTVKQRLAAAGADLSRVHMLSVGPDAYGGHRALQFPEEASLLRESLQETGARLVIADPLVAFLGGGAGLNGPQIRRALTPLANIAQQAHATLAMARHLNKNDGRQSALYRGSGSIQVIACARVGLLAGCHPEDPDLHLLACFKNNLAERPPTLSFRIHRDQAGWPIIDWEGAVPISADEIVLTTGERYGISVARAVEFLRETLAGNPRPRQEVSLLAQDEGLSPTTLKRARTKLHVVCNQIWQDGRNVWFWRLPAAATVEEEHALLMQEICRGS